LFRKAFRSFLEIAFFSISWEVFMTLDSSVLPGPPQASASAGARLDALRASLRKLEVPGRAEDFSAERMSLGLAALDGHFPGGGLSPAALQEILPAGGEGDEAAACGFCLALLASWQGFLDLSSEKPLLWIGRAGDFYPPAVLAYGLDPAAFLMVQPRDGAAETLWAMEEALRCRKIAAVVGEVEALPLHADRRLQLLAEESMRPAFLLRRSGFARPGQAQGARAAAYRWRIAPLAEPQASQRDPLWGPAWRVELLRCREAAPGNWDLLWNNPEKKEDAPGGFALAAPLRHGSLAAPAFRCAG
jgi:protein ImuA